jgi:hypothetical protein
MFPKANIRRCKRDRGTISGDLWKLTVRFELSHAAYVGYVGFPYLSVRQ